MTTKGNIHINENTMLTASFTSQIIPNTHIALPHQIYADHYYGSDLFSQNCGEMVIVIFRSPNKHILSAHIYFSMNNFSTVMNNLTKLTKPYTLEHSDTKTLK